MTAQIKELPSPEKRRNESAIEKLKQALEEAERGEIESVVMVVIKPNGDFQTRQSAGISKLQLMGMLETAKFDQLTET